MKRLSTCSCARKFGRARAEVSPAHALRPFPRRWPARRSFGHWLRRPLEWARLGAMPICTTTHLPCPASANHAALRLALARTRRTSQRDGPRGPRRLHHIDRGPAHDRAPLKYPPPGRRRASISAPPLLVQFVSSRCIFSLLSIPRWRLQQHRVRFPPSSMCGLS